jgi:hypothetical protein
VYVGGLPVFSSLPLRRALNKYGNSSIFRVLIQEIGVDPGVAPSENGTATSV